MSTQKMTRRAAMRLIAGAPLAAGVGGFPAAAHAADTVKCINLGFVLGIHCPPTFGILDECPKLGLQVEMQRFQRMRDALQTVSGGTGDIGISEPIMLLHSRQAGNDIVIFGNHYLHTTLVVVVNADFIQTWKDLEKPDVTVGINSQGDITQVMTIGGFLKNGGDLAKVKWADVGGSGTRVRALLSKRVQATQSCISTRCRKSRKAATTKCCWCRIRNTIPGSTRSCSRAPTGSKIAANRRKAVMFMKGIIIGSRKANADFAYYRNSFVKYATLKEKDTMPEAEMRAHWNALSREIGVWPADNAFRVSNLEKLLPYYRAAKAIDDKPIDLKAATDLTIVAQALKELG